MLTCEQLYESFQKLEMNFFTGVPDSTFKDWMKFLADKHGKGLTNIMACNECEAVATAAGYHLATGKFPVVYMQNSGEGKAVNPLVSLCDKEVYSIPLLMLIGWRGEPGKKDEPQHIKMGRITESLLDVLEIPHEVLPENPTKVEEALKRSVAYMKENNSPYALIVKKGTFKAYEAKKFLKTNHGMPREDAIKVIIENFNGSEVVVSTTGKTSRELFECRVNKEDIPHDFYTVGSMGCSASIANGIALEKCEKQVFVFDGDGSIIMQMGSLATIGHYAAKNLYHIVFDNNAYDSTGGQPTVASSIDFKKIALACGYKSAKTVETKEKILASLKDMKSSDGPYMLIVKVNKGSRKDLGRPTTTPIENKKIFMEHLK